MSDTPAAVAPVAAPAAPDNSGSWISGITDSDIVGYAQARGYDKLDLPSAFLEAAKAHRSAEKMIGAPADQLVRIPRPEDQQGWQQVWQRLGAPKEASEYDFKSLELDTPEMTDRFHTAIRQTASELSMPKAMAERFAAKVHDWISQEGQSTAASETAYVQGEMQRLHQEWGAPESVAFKGRMFTAMETARKLGMNEEALDRIGNTLSQNGVGYADVIKMFHKIGVAMGEDRYVTGQPGQGPSNPNVMTPEMAKERLNMLIHDSQWRQRVLAKDPEALKEKDALDRIAATTLRLP